MQRSAQEILSDPKTPQWIRDGFRRIEQRDPSYAAFLKAIHDYRVGAATELGPNHQPQGTL